MQPHRSLHRASGKNTPVRRPMADLYPLIGPREDNLMITGDRAASQGGKADFSPCSSPGLPLPAELLYAVKIHATAKSRRLAQH